MAARFTRQSYCFFVDFTRFYAMDSDFWESLSAFFVFFIILLHFEIK